LKRGKYLFLNVDTILYMIWRILTAIFTGILVHTASSYGQFYTSGEPPASIKWNYIKTPHFNIIFSKDICSTAINLANILEYSKQSTEKTLSHQVKKMPVLLHNTSVISNGYVTWAPKRMELVTTPPQDSYSQDWLSQLALHEYRHVVQIDKLHQGFTKALSLLTGEIATGGISSLLPTWFYEGDAVLNETLLSETGRGRVSGFEMPLRTLAIQKQASYSYNKAVFGSYKDFVPSQYLYGYQIVSYANSRYGNDIWTSALDYTAKHPYLIWPMEFYLKSRHGLYKSGLYRNMMDSIKYLYNKQKDTIIYTDYLNINKRISNSYIQYLLPKDLGNGNILVLKISMDYPDSFIMIDSSGMEKIVHTPGLTMGYKCDVYGNRLIWDGVASDPRWGRRDYSEINVFNLKSRKCTLLTKNTRYFSPDFSPDGHKIAVIETDEQNKHFITILDAFSGLVTRKIPAPVNKEIQLPEWISNTGIAVITVSAEGKQIEQIDLNTDQWTVLLPYTRFDISELVNYKNYILFRSAYNGIDNIYAISKTESDVYQVTFSQFGAKHPEISRDSANLLFSDYGVSGFNVVKTRIDSNSWTKVNTAIHPSGLWPGTKSGENAPLVPGDITNVKYEAKPYNRFTHLLHFHSWLPFYTDVTDFTSNIHEIPVDLGVIFYSQNLLSTVISSVGYRYYNGYHSFSPTVSWRGWYPVFEFSGQFGGPASSINLPEGITLNKKRDFYKEFTLKSYIPLIYNRGRDITYLLPQIEYKHSNTYYYDDERLYTGIGFIHYRFFLSHYLRKSFRDLYPRWGQVLSLTYTESPADRNQFGNMYAIETEFFFPGLFAHHHLYFMAGYQKQNTEKYYLPLNRVNFPRGYSSAVSREFISTAVNYSFPVGYPDLSMGILLYLKRIRMNLFHDWSYGTSVVEKTSSGNMNYTGSYRSYGTEILSDFHLMRIIFPMTAGIRLGYIPGKQRFFTEMIINMQTNIF
jgi:hypothetical protein